MIKKIDPKVLVALSIATSLLGFLATFFLYRFDDFWLSSSDSLSPRYVRFIRTRTMLQNIMIFAPFFSYLFLSVYSGIKKNFYLLLASLTGYVPLLLLFLLVYLYSLLSVVGVIGFYFSHPIITLILPAFLYLIALVLNLIKKEYFLSLSILLIILYYVLYLGFFLIIFSHRY